MEKTRVKRRAHYDDETLERMKQYYKIEDHNDLLRFPTIRYDVYKF
jgi:hypothetical protein